MRHGSSAETIAEYADEEDVDLVVLGTKSRPNGY